MSGLYRKGRKITCMKQQETKKRKKAEGEDIGK